MIRIRDAIEQVRSSFFFLPALFLLGGIILAFGTLALDTQVDTADVPSPLRLDTDTARAMLSTIAAATITVAATVFSISVVAVQLASSQFSPRTMRTFLRDRVLQVAMGLTVGTFAFALVTLRGAGGAYDATDPTAPHVSVSVAMLLAGVAAISILAFIDHTARAMQVGRIIRSVTNEACALLGREFPDRDADPPPDHTPPRPDGPTLTVRATATGWVGQVDIEAARRCVPEGGVLALAAAPGVFARPGTVLATLTPAPEEDDARRAAEATVRGAFTLGADRTMQQDLSYGLLQLSDIAVRALSPGVNDPSTAAEAIEHLGAVLRAALDRGHVPVATERDDRWVVRAADLSFEDYVHRAFDEIRRAGAGDLRVTLDLLRILADLSADAEALGRTHDAAILRSYARVVLDGARTDGIPAHDRSLLDDAAVWARG